VHLIALTRLAAIGGLRRALGANERRHKFGLM